MFIVIVSFTPSAAQVEGNYDAVHAILDDLVSRQPGFRRARVHMGHAGGEPRVVNYMEWDSEADFQTFRAAHGPTVTERIGPFGPQFAFYDTVSEIGAAVPA